MTLSVAISSALKVALVFWASSALGTTLIALTTGTEVYLGADSRGQGGERSLCKLIKTEKLAVGTSGHLRNSATQFDVANYITAALGRSVDLESAIENVSADLEAPLARSIAWVKANRPVEFGENYDNQKILELLLVTAVNGEPRVAVLIWRAQDGQVVRDAPTNLGAMQSLVVGNNTTVEAYQKSHPEWVNLPASTIVEKFLTLEAEGEPDFVGPPFSIIRMSTAGAHWLKSGVCGSLVSNK
jgi:hypothetical protein